MELFKKMYQLTDKQEAAKKDLNQYMLLVNYIDRYKEKMGIAGSSIHKGSVVERVLNFVNQKRGRTAADQVIDFESFK